jgi:hypothetical protein
LFYDKGIKMVKEYLSPLQQIMVDGWAKANGQGAVVYRDAMRQIQDDDDRSERRSIRDADYRSNTAVWDGNDWVERRY